MAKGKVSMDQVMFSAEEKSVENKKHAKKTNRSTPFFDLSLIGFISSDIFPFDLMFRLHFLSSWWVVVLPSDRKLQGDPRIDFLLLFHGVISKHDRSQIHLDSIAETKALQKITYSLYLPLEVGNYTLTTGESKYMN